MINIQISMEDGEMEIYATGHANYDENGKDIVCAAVSIIMQTAALGLQAVSEKYPDHVKVHILGSGPQ